MAASSSKRALWKGAISFGLVHIPIALHSATTSQGVDFDWLDKRSMDPVGYKRINKATGKEISQDNIVKGVKYSEGEYVVLSAEELATAYPKSTQTIEIEAFVAIDAIPFIYLDRPYYTSPIGKGDKVYALLREVLHKSGKVGIAKVVIQTKQHLAILMACGPALILNLLHWDDEIRAWDELNLPPQGVKAAGLTEKEMKMGAQLIEDMSAPWQPHTFVDSFKEQILALVKEKVEAGETETVGEPEPHETEGAGAKILDLTEMLQRSLGKGRATNERKPAKPARKTGGKAANKASAKTPRKAAARKTAKTGSASTKAAGKSSAKSRSRKAA
ncbi:Ku protein [Pusillimonas sp. SM2304]|uniref:non-homologous end joining protein Ku n=1 Tax=Pusillimonas sp. SM2304 TaxID=3073241 RepID=UPI002876637C|nr:Ku protein [Pusillimonas sp. SM2304]MDS1141977.1 Ku protein [Pusillimonas sp. SM2304]